MDIAKITSKIQIKQIELSNEKDPEKRVEIQKAISKLRIQKQLAMLNKSN